MTLLLLASAFCVEAFAAPSYIYSGSRKASGTYKSTKWSAYIEVYGSQTATASFDSSFKGRFWISFSARAYRKNQGQIDEAHPVKLSTDDDVFNNSVYTAQVRVYLTSPGGNLATPALYAKANDKTRNSTIKTLTLDPFG